MAINPFKRYNLLHKTLLSVLEFITKVFLTIDNLCIPLDATNGFPVLSEWGTCRNGIQIPRSVRGFWLFTKKNLLSKVKGMDDRGIMRIFHLCAQIF